MPNNHKELDMLGVRAVLCAIIEHSIVQAGSRSAIIRDEALSFLHSKTYEDICYALDLPADNLRQAAYDTRNNKDKERKRRQAPQGSQLREVPGKLRPDIQEEEGYEQ
jgi:hypothetical protein